MEGNNYSLADLSAACGCNNGGMNNWFNNPFMYLIWLAYMGNGGLGFGNRGADAAATAALSGQIDGIRNQMADNQNTNTLGAAIGGNNEMLHNLMGAVNMGFAGTAANINAASTGNLLGQKDMQSAMQSCCCEQKTLTQTMGYESQLRDQANHANTMQRIDTLANGVQQGFSAIGFQMAQDKAGIVENANTNTQRILDTLNNHWTSDLQQKYQDAKLELSQLNQNATLIAALKTT